MPKMRKMLGDADAPYIVSLMGLIETQSKATIAKWCLDYTQENILPIFERRCPDDDRPRRALDASRDWFEGRKTLPEVRAILLNECHAAEECVRVEAAQRSVAVGDEPNPAKINWQC